MDIISFFSCLPTRDRSAFIFRLDRWQPDLFLFLLRGCCPSRAWLMREYPSHHLLPRAIFSLFLRTEILLLLLAFSGFLIDIGGGWKKAVHSSADRRRLSFFYMVCSLRTTADDSRWIIHASLLLFSHFPHHFSLGRLPSCGRSIDPFSYLVSSSWKHKYGPCVFSIYFKSFSYLSPVFSPASKAKKFQSTNSR